MSAKALEILIEEFNKLPGIGKKSATRLAFHILDLSTEEVEKMVDSIKMVKNKIKKCKVCHNFSEKDVCDICSDESRNKSVICVVEDSRDIVQIENAKTYQGMYHILNGKIAPLNGITPDKLNIKSLLNRLSSESVEEILLALNTDLEGETTILYLTKLLKPLNIKITKLANGIPMGGNIEFADMATLSRAIEQRQKL